jgi:hypothetical protein
MNGLEEQADNAKARDPFWQSLSWLGTLRPSSATDAFDLPLWETVFASTIGLEVPFLSPALMTARLLSTAAKNTYHVLSWP